jgi:hypothetical protein
MNDSAIAAIPNKIFLFTIVFSSLFSLAILLCGILSAASSENRYPSNGRLFPVTRVSGAEKKVIDTPAPPPEVTAFRLETGAVRPEGGVVEVKRGAFWADLSLKKDSGES